MNSNNDLYDVFNMQHEDMQTLISEEEQLLEKDRKFNAEAEAFNNNADKKLRENIEWLRSMGITLDDELSEAKKKADEEADRLIKEAEKANEVYQESLVSYEQLVELAHERGYTNTTIQDLLTEDEIQIADKRLQDIEKGFADRTKLKKVDIAFLVTAIALQVVRQYAITPFSERGTADDASKIMEERYGNGGRLSGKYYYATEETIICQKKVPFDIIAGSKKFGLGKDGKGLSGNTHRFRSLGHDPILGYIFGTANIVTNTATWWNGTSHHIMYKPNAGGAMIPTITANADTGKMFDHVVKRFKSDGGKRILVEAVVKEHLHLKSDISTDGLPIPFMQSISPDFAQSLAEHGLDAIALGDIVKQAAGAEFINFLISTIHSLICAEKGETDRKLYQVRTRKIILISNVIASASNIIAVGIAAGVGVAGENPEAVKKAVKYLDVGGILVTVAHLFKDLRFVSKVKEEFLKSKLDAQLLEELNNLDEYFDS